MGVRIACLGLGFFLAFLVLALLATAACAAEGPTPVASGAIAGVVADKSTVPGL